MAVQPWRAIILVFGGAAVGVAIAGLPSRGEDPPLHVRTDAGVSTTTTVVVTTTTTETTAAAAPPSSTPTTRRKP